MKILVFGATGNTGHQLVKILLERGHEVTAIVRRPGQLELIHERLKVIKGDVLNTSTFKDTMAGKDAVLSALGVNHRKPTTVYSVGAENIMRVMMECEVQRFICISSASLKPIQNLSFMEKALLQLVLKRILKNIYKDMESMEQKVRQSKLDWTIIRPPRLTNGPRTSKYRIAINQPVSKSRGIRGISRADLAECMVQLLENPDSINGMVEVSY
jgi:putative NADH-flavin reductase